MTGTACLQARDAGEHRAVTSLREACLSLLQSSSGGWIGCRRVQVVAPETDLCRWAAGAPFEEKVYWRDRDGRASAGVGRADAVALDAEDPFGAMRRGLGGGPRAGLRYYGGLVFDPLRPGAVPSWFGRCGGFLLPRFERRRDVLACHLRWPDDAAPEGRARLRSAFDRLLESRPVGPAFPRCLDRRDLPSRPDWGIEVGEILQGIAAGRFEKVVLARRTDLHFDGPVPPWRLVDRLAALGEGCCVFALQRGGETFLGATPEILYRRRGVRVRTEALAGTRPRGKDAVEDGTLREDLLASSKDRLEQGIVVEMVSERMARMCRRWRMEEKASVREVPEAQHLLSRGRGILDSGTDDADLLRALHPTPAVGGTPRAAALAEIRKREPFPRGWYAAPVGWVGGDGAVFAVAIRSAVVRGGEVRLYSGAGIVAGSRPEEEWDETEAKIRMFLEILCG